MRYMQEYSCGRCGKQGMSIHGIDRHICEQGQTSKIQPPETVRLAPMPVKKTAIINGREIYLPRPKNDSGYTRFQWMEIALRDCDRSQISADTIKSLFQDWEDDKSPHLTNSFMKAVYKQESSSYMMLRVVGVWLLAMAGLALIQFFLWKSGFHP